MAKRWTEEEKETLIKLRKEGLTAREIAEQVPDRSEDTIKNMLAKLLPKNRKWMPEEDNIIKELYLEGASYKEITSKLTSRTLDATKQRVALVISELVKEGSCEYRKKAYAWLPGYTDLIIKMRQEGKTYREMAEATNTTVGVIYTRIAALVQEGRLEVKSVQKDWTEEEELLIADWRDQGKNTDFIATQLGRSYQSVAHRISKHIKAGALDPHISTDQATKVYLVHFIEEDFYKIGITSNVWARFQGYPKYKIIEVLELESHEEAKRIEAELLSMVQPFRYTPLIFKSYGITECFQTGTHFQSFEDLISFCQG